MSKALALVTAASGVGDILRVTPLVRVLGSLGYEVDVLLSPDYPEAASLLEGTEEIRRLFCVPSAWAGGGVAQDTGIGDEKYEIATFTIWSEPFRRSVRAGRVLAFDRRQWMRDGDSACVRAMAASLGWTGALPPPLAVASDVDFGLPPGTVTLHPGCKPNWPWKKWHGFAELAALLPQVALIGTAADLDNRATYFARDFIWPARARNFVGRLTLKETAAVIAQSAALVANDSGLMHLGVALGVPTVGVFGITSPEREAIPASNMFPITKGLPCERACRQCPWGRRDCEHHLQCLKVLTAGEVLERVKAAISGIAPARGSGPASGGASHG